MWVNCYEFYDNNFSKLVKPFLVSDTFKIKISNSIKKLGPMRYDFLANKSVYQEELIQPEPIQEEIIETPDTIEEVIIEPQPIQEDEIETEFNKVGYYIFKNITNDSGRIVHISKISKCYMWVNCYEFSDNNFSKLV